MQRVLGILLSVAILVAGWTRFEAPRCGDAGCAMSAAHACSCCDAGKQECCCSDQAPKAPQQPAPAPEPRGEPAQGLPDDEGTEIVVPARPLGRSFARPTEEAPRAAPSRPRQILLSTFLI